MSSSSILKTCEGLRHLSMPRQQDDCFQVKYSSFIIFSVVGHYSSSHHCCRFSLSFGRCDLQSRFAINSQSLVVVIRCSSLSRQIAFGNPFLPLFLLAPLPSALAIQKQTFVLGRLSPDRVHRSRRRVQERKVTNWDVWIRNLLCVLFYVVQKHFTYIHIT